MKLPVFAILLSVASAAQAATFADIEGAWIVDLRVNAATDKPYTQPMILKIEADRRVSGSFYNSDIIDGRASLSNNRLCVAFKTTDGVGLYQHSGCLVDGKVVGQSWAEQRKFLLNWSATRK
jgi:hypothetical protein